MKDSNSENNKNSKRKSTHKLLFSPKESSFLIKGLSSGSIVEDAIPVTLNGSQVGNFQGFEIYEKLATGTPQTIADIISNCYLRLTYPKPNCSSATFGTSVITCPSFRTSDKRLCFLPQTQQAIMSIEDAEIQVELKGKYDHVASFRSIRKFQSQTNMLSNMATYKIFFSTLEDIHLDKTSSACDMFRFVTISSMFSSSQRYDANVIEYSKEQEEAQQLALGENTIRGKYLFTSLTQASQMSAIKTTGTIGKMNTPGSVDSPSIQVRWVAGSIPINEIGIQAYLDQSTNINDDSLSIWLEWTAAPSFLPKGFEFWAEFEVRASAPRFL